LNVRSLNNVQGVLKLMTFKNTKTILFASLIVAMILPFSGMNYATAQETNKSIDSYYVHPPTENETSSATKLANVLVIFEKLSADRAELVSQISASGNENIIKQLDRLELMQQLANLKLKMALDPKNIEQYQEEGALVAEILANTFDKSESEPAIILNENDEITPSGHTTTNYQTNSHTRYHCGAQTNLTGYSDGTISPTWPLGSNWDNTWHYPIDATNTGSPTCEEYDHVKSTALVIKYAVFCPVDVTDFDAQWWCNASGGDLVTIYSNSYYDINGSTQKYHPQDTWDLIYIN